MIALDVSAAYATANGTDRGRRMQALMVEDEKVVAPTLFFSEAANAAWKLARFGGADRAFAVEKMKIAVELVDEFFPDEEMMAEALDEAIKFGHAVCDMLYLVLARRTGATLFTLEKKLAAVCREARVNCIEEVAL
ncbi:MAG TPA: type II toxin-antitoxin system VapC family toxin [Candidatus Aphodovivens avistercoris]|nr:type II toxin-antitoxin system VapC family toxin [Candidatus Aphodovivens avistercoris]